MLPRENRLRSREAFDRLRREGKRWRGRLLTLSIAPTQLGRVRFGFIVTRKVGNAVTRNRMRRRMRAIIRLRLPLMQAASADAVLIGYQGAVGAAHRELEKEIDHLLAQAGLL
ncbi:MAG: ribonuclease P protein component [Chloroflexi bacterium]|nr:ribonuclease P protein component [Chloroflexota bacterium]